MKKNKYLIIGMGLALIGFLCFCFLFEKVSEVTKRNTYDIVCFGDSILGNYRGDTAVTAYLERETGKTIANCAFGGSTLALGNQQQVRDNKVDTLSLTRITQAIKMKDYSILKSEFQINDDIKDYFPETLKLIDSIDYDKTEIIIIELGLNDYMSQIPLENPENPYDCYSFAGALRNSLEILKTECPHSRIILCTPNYTAYEFVSGTIQGCDEYDFGGGYLYEYVDVIKTIGTEYQVEVLDNYYEMGINKENLSQYTEDNIHLNETGRELLAKRLAEKIKNK